jgi:hypothetical protein
LITHHGKNNKLKCVDFWFGAKVNRKIV